MLFVVVIMSGLTAFEVINLLRQTGDKAFKTFLGYAWIVEIICSLVLPAIAMTTGALTAVLISIVAGTMVTATLEVLKRTVGTRKYKKVNGKRTWVESQGVPFATFTREFGISLFNKVKQFALDVAKPATV